MKLIVIGNISCGITRTFAHIIIRTFSQIIIRALMRVSYIPFTLEHVENQVPDSCFFIIDPKPIKSSVYEPQKVVSPTSAFLLRPLCLIMSRSVALGRSDSENSVDDSQINTIAMHGVSPGNVEAQRFMTVCCQSHNS